MSPSREGTYVQAQEFLMTADTLHALDIIEVSFRVVDTVAREYYGVDQHEGRVQQSADEAIEELNVRFKEHGIGYQFEGGRIVKVTSQFIHAEVVKPALALLHEVGFTGPSDEFMQAHIYYRTGKTKDAITWALKAFESTMRAICDAHSWNYASGATASMLIAVLFQEALVPTYLQNQFTGLRTMLEAGVPTVRNKTSGHGQGATPVDVPDHIAAYALHMAAANIVLLVQAHKAKT